MKKINKTGHPASVHETDTMPLNEASQINSVKSNTGIHDEVVSTQPINNNLIVGFKPGMEAIGKGIFLPPEFIQFARQLYFMHDWFEVYGSMCDEQSNGSARSEYAYNISSEIMSIIVDLANKISTIAGIEYLFTFFWNVPYDVCKAEHFIGKKNQRLAK